MYRFDVRADNVHDLGPVVIIEATPLAPKLVATLNSKEAQIALERLGLGGNDVQLIMKTFADGIERIVNVETTANLLEEAGFLKHS